MTTIQTAASVETTDAEVIAAEANSVLAAASTQHETQHTDSMPLDSNLHKDTTYNKMASTNSSAHIQRQRLLSQKVSTFAFYGHVSVMHILQTIIFKMNALHIWKHETKFMVRSELRFLTGSQQSYRISLLQEVKNS